MNANQLTNTAQINNLNSLTANDIRANVNLIQEVMKGIMKKETHYGKIFGSAKPVLFKAGSEVLLSTFRISVHPEVIDLSQGNEIRYLVKAKGVHQLSGVCVGEGIGECSTNEEKYAWRAAICPEEFEATPENMRRVKFSKYQGNVKRVNQVRTNAADLANTVLKMAKKRAQMDLTLTATGASDIFTQDIEDLPEEYVSQMQQPTQQAEAKPQQQAEKAGYPDADFKKNFPKWAAAIKGGKQTAKSVIAKVESKAALTNQQKTQIRNVK